MSLAELVQFSDLHAFIPYLIRFHKVHLHLSTKIKWVRRFISVFLSLLLLQVSLSDNVASSLIFPVNGKLIKLPVAVAFVVYLYVWQLLYQIYNDLSSKKGHFLGIKSHIFNFDMISRSDIYAILNTRSCWELYV